MLIIFEVGLMVMALAMLAFKNVMHWHRFGILTHNEFYFVRTGVFKSVAFLKTFFGSSFLSCVCLYLLFTKSFRRDMVMAGVSTGPNWLMILLLTPCLILLARSMLFGHRISKMQLAASVLCFSVIICSLY